MRYIPNGSSVGKGMPLGSLSRRFGVERRKYIIFVGRLIECKRVDLLARAYASISTDYKLVVVGDGPAGIVDPLKAECANNSGIVFTGPLYGDELAAVFSNASLFVLPWCWRAFQSR